MKARDVVIGFAFVISPLAGCGGNGEYAKAPGWVIALVRQDAARLDEESPKIDFAACGPSTCIVRLFGSFRDGDSRAPRLDLELNIRERPIRERVFYYDA